MEYKYRNGYAALASVLVIAAIVLTVTITTPLIGINDIQGSLSNNKSFYTRYILEGCIEDTLLKLNENGTLATNIITPEGNCTNSLISQVGNTFTFTSTSTINGYTKTVQVSATRSSSIITTDWHDL